MIKTLLSLSLILFFSVPYAFAGRSNRLNQPDSVYLFAYGNNGLKFAWSQDKQNWKVIGNGHPYIRSDYGEWGREKKMNTPYLYKEKSGKWQLVWSLLSRCAKIGYEPFIERAFVFQAGTAKMDAVDLRRFSTNQTEYTIVDIRNSGEVKEHPAFENAINIPLPELMKRISEIPSNKPIVIHCAGGYRSAAGSSIINNALGDNAKVYDLGENIKAFL